MYTFTINPDRTPSKPLSPSETRVFLSTGKAAVFKRYPFTLILKEPIATTEECRIKIDPGAKTTGFAVLMGDRVIWAAELQHRGMQITMALEKRASLRRGRRSRNTRYRPARWENRRRVEDWIAPSLMSRVDNTMTWIKRIMAIAPVTAISMESVRFDTQKLDNAEISGVEYQQGTLAGYEVREYLLEKFNRKCVYCDRSLIGYIRTEIEHIHPRSKGGSNSVRNLAIACQPCNQKKGNKTIDEFLGKDKTRLERIKKQVRSPLTSAAAVNITRRFLQRQLFQLGIPIECSSGGRTKFNRIQRGLPKEHWIDAACVGASTPENLIVDGIKPLLIKATGHGSRQMQQNDKYGFPKGTPRSRNKESHGFKTGDMAIAVIPKGKNEGTHIGRVTVRKRPAFAVSSQKGKIDGIHPRHMKKIHCADGYEYS